MSDTNATPPKNNPVIQASIGQCVKTDSPSTADSIKATRSVSVKSTTGEVRIRYAPVNPKQK